MSAVVRDITERKRAELELRLSAQAMQRLARGLVEVHDAEQRRISGELHDVLGQNLAALGMNLKLVSQRLPVDLAGPLRPVLARSRQLLESSIAFTRTLMSELRPPTLDEYGLLAGLRWYGAQLEASTGLAMTVDGHEPVPRLERATEMALFRITQEALANTLKHGQARNVRLELRPDDERVVLTIADDGTGFEVAQFPKHGHWGLTLMGERAAAVGARLRMESAPGRGTRVIVEMSRAA